MLKKSKFDELKMYDLFKTKLELKMVVSLLYISFYKKKTWNNPPLSETNLYLKVFFHSRSAFPHPVENPSAIPAVPP